MRFIRIRARGFDSNSERVLTPTTSSINSLKAKQVNNVGSHQDTRLRRGNKALRVFGICKSIVQGGIQLTCTPSLLSANRNMSWLQ